MAIVFEAVEINAVYYRSNTITLDRPSVVNEGDVLIGYAVVNSAYAITIPAGWTLLSAWTYPAAYGGSLSYRVATVSEPTSYDWTMNGSTHAGGSILRFSGVDNAAPIDNSITVNTGNSLTPVSPDHTTLSDDAMVIRSQNHDQFVVTEDAGYPADHTGIFNRNGSGFSYGTAYALQSVPGVTGIATWGDHTSVDDWHAHTFALRPASIVGGAAFTVIRRQYQHHLG